MRKKKFLSQKAERANSPERGGGEDAAAILKKLGRIPR